MTLISKRPLYPGSRDTSVAAYSPGIAVGDLVFVSGQGPVDAATKTFILGSIEQETEVTLRNVGAVLAEAGCSLADIVKATVHLADLRDFAAFNRTYERLVPEPRPARTTVQSGLGHGIKVEIDVIAFRNCGVASPEGDAR